MKTPKVGDKVYLDTDDSYIGVITRIKGILVYLDGQVTGFPIERWIVC